MDVEPQSLHLYCTMSKQFVTHGKLPAGAVGQDSQLRNVRFTSRLGHTAFQLAELTKKMPDYMAIYGLIHQKYIKKVP